MSVQSLTRRALVQAGTAGLLLRPLHAALAADIPLARPSDAALIAAARAEGGLSTYGSSSVVAVRSDAEGFEKAYGIHVTYTQITSAPLTARIDQEIKGGGMAVDVVTTADRAALDRWVAAGQLAPLPQLNFPGQTQYLAQIQAVYHALLYNTDAVHNDALPRRWADVLEPRFAGKIVLGTPRIAPGFSQLYYALLKNPAYGEKFFEALARQKPVVVQTPVLVAQSVASGEADIGFTGLPYEAENILARTPAAPIAYTYLDVITGAYTYVGINAKARHPKAAQLFAAWLMSPEGQVAHNGDHRASSALGDLPGTLRAPDPTKLDPTSADEVVADYDRLKGLFDRLFG